LVAHSAIVSPKRVKNLFQDNEIARLLIDYPESLDQICWQLRRDFLYLAKLKEFRHTKSATTPDAMLFGFYKFLEQMTDI